MVQTYAFNKNMTKAQVLNIETVIKSIIKVDLKVYNFNASKEKKSVSQKFQDQIERVL